MGDATSAGRAVGDHWVLLVALGGGVGGVALFLKLVANTFDSRTDERLKLAMENGIGAKLSGKIAVQVKAAVLEALSEHQVQCPHAARVSDLAERVVSLERRE